MPSEPALPPATVAAYMALALQDLVDKLTRNQRPVPHQVRELAALYRGWAQPGGAAMDLPAVDSEQALLLTKGEAARLLGVSERTVQRRVSSGQLRAVHVDRRPRFRPADLDAYLDRCGGPPVDSGGPRWTGPDNPPSAAGGGPP